MHVVAITKPEHFQSVAANWEQVYGDDPEAQIFLSHQWLRTWLSFVGSGWLILAAKPCASASDYFGFFPLRVRRGTQGTADGGTRLVAAGSRTADFTGFLCPPDVELGVARAFGAALMRFSANRIDLDNLLVSDRRLVEMLSAAQKAGGRIGHRRGTDNGDGIDLSIAPFTRLPSSWEELLNSSMSSNSRQKARRFLRKLDDGTELSVTHASAETRERDILILCRLWLDAWASRKGAAAARKGDFIRHTLAGFHRSGVMDICVLWRGDRPLAAHALYIDRRKRALHFSVGACDKTVQSPPPSFLLHCYSLRKAIADGFTLYDFMRGDEPYKASFATETRRVRHVSIERPMPAPTNP